MLFSYYKEIFSFLSVVVTFISFFPYIKLILNNVVKPHGFSWFIWGITTLVVFFAQYIEGGGVGAIPTLISSGVTFFIATLAFTRKRKTEITKLDWLFLVLALSSLPFWYATSNALTAVMVLTFVDLLGFGPTFRKAYQNPFEENITFFGYFILRNVFSVVALEAYNWTTLLFPITISIATLGLIFILIYRRRQLK